jgi:hypothetical protein
MSWAWKKSPVLIRAQASNYVLTELTVFQENFKKQFHLQQKLLFRKLKKIIKNQKSQFQYAQYVWWHV